MYRRLIIFGLAVCGSALIALLVPLALAARDIVQADQLGQAAAKARAVANDWQRQDPKDEKAPPFDPPASDTAGTITLYYPDGTAQGPDPQGAQRAVEAASRGGAASDIVDGSGYVTAPAYFDEEFGVVLVSLTPDELREGLMPRLAALAGCLWCCSGWPAVPRGGWRAGPSRLCATSRRRRMRWRPGTSPPEPRDRRSTRSSTWVWR
jgi:hypothetical protein